MVSNLKGESLELDQRIAPGIKSLLSPLKKEWQKEKKVFGQTVLAENLR